MTTLSCYPNSICRGQREVERVLIQTQLESEVLRKAENYFRLVTSENMQRILRETGLSKQEIQETCANATCAADIGGALGADYIIQGRIIRRAEVHIC